jgi:exoribonuclease R
MADADRRAAQFERAVIDLAESLVLAPRVGERFAATVVEVDRRDPHRGVVMLSGPAIEAGASAAAPLGLGTSVQVELVEADPARRRIAFHVVA